MLRKNHRCGDRGEENGLYFYPNYDLQSKRAGSLDGKRILYQPIFKQFQTRRDVWYNKSLWINFMMFIMSLKTYNYYTFETLGSECTAGNHRKMFHSIFRIECVPVASQTQPYLMCKTVLEHLSEKQKLHTPDVHHYTKIPLHNNTGQISY